MLSQRNERACEIIDEGVGVRSVRIAEHLCRSSGQGPGKDAITDRRQDRPRAIEVGGPTDRGLHPAARMRVHQRRRDFGAYSRVGADRSKRQVFSDGPRHGPVRIEVVPVDDPRTGCSSSRDDPFHDRRERLRPGRVQPAGAVENHARTVAGSSCGSWIGHIRGQDVNAGRHLGPTGPTDQADPHAAGDELPRDGKSERACPEDRIGLAHASPDPPVCLSPWRLGWSTGSTAEAPFPAMTLFYGRSGLPNLSAERTSSGGLRFLRPLPSFRFGYPRGRTADTL